LRRPGGLGVSHGLGLGRTRAGAAAPPAPAPAAPAPPALARGLGLCDLGPRDDVPGAVRLSGGVGLAPLGGALPRRGVATPAAVPPLLGLVAAALLGGALLLAADPALDVDPLAHAAGGLEDVRLAVDRLLGRGHRLGVEQ